LVGLKVGGGHWASITVQPLWQKCKTKNGQGFSAQWTELKAALLALASAILEECCYIIFTDSWIVANGLFGLLLRN
jgi:ribonuclease HI